MSDEFIQIDFGQFFDRPAVQNAVDRAERRVLSKAGAFVRQRARSSIRKRKGISQPGQPPSSHAGELRDRILFAYDPGRDSVFIGPLLFRKKRSDGSLHESGAEVLEFGGTARRLRDGKTLHYAARPYMWPALEAEADNFPHLWLDQVRA